MTVAAVSDGGFTAAHVGEPAATDVILDRLGTGAGLKGVIMRQSPCVAVPLPNCPNSFSPQASTSPCPSAGAGALAGD